MRGLCAWLSSWTFIAYFILSAAPAVAAPILDQSCCDFYTGAFVLDDALTRAQTFTVGTGGVLIGIALDLQAFDSGALTVEIHGAVDAGMSVAALGPPLAATTLIWSGGELGYVFGALTEGIDVLPGDVLTLVQKPTDPTASSTAWWQIHFGAPYAAGEALSTDIFNPDILSSAFGDAGFRTFVEPVPEPSAVILFGTAVASACLRRRKGSGCRSVGRA